ncbi:MAG TPA: invasion associated locus B family protein [Aliidongia sp.]|nr:invasion associated locus B family protein [Aliidongia sp.]
MFLSSDALIPAAAGRPDGRTRTKLLPMLAGALLLTATAGAEAATGPAPAAAAPVAAAAAPEGPRLTMQSFGGWGYRCQQAMVDGKPGNTACALSQGVTVQQDGKNQTVMTVTVTAAPDAKSHAITIQVPLGVRLKPGLSLAVDDGTAQALAFDYCGPRGCWVAGAPIDGLVEALKTGKTGRGRIVLLNGRELAIEFPLAGFAAGLAALDAGHAPAVDAKPADAKAKAKAK